MWWSYSKSKSPCVVLMEFQSHVSCTAGRLFTTEPLEMPRPLHKWALFHFIYSFYTYLIFMGLAKKWYISKCIHTPSSVWSPSGIRVQYLWVLFNSKEALHLLHRPPEQMLEKDMNDWGKSKLGVKLGKMWKYLELHAWPKLSCITKVSCWKTEQPSSSYEAVERKASPAAWQERLISCHFRIHRSENELIQAVSHHKFISDQTSKKKYTLKASSFGYTTCAMY